MQHANRRTISKKRLDVYGAPLQDIYWKTTFTSRINIQYFFALDAMVPAFLIGQKVKLKVKKK